MNNPDNYTVQIITQDGNYTIYDIVAGNDNVLFLKFDNDSNFMGAIVKKPYGGWDVYNNISKVKYNIFFHDKINKFRIVNDVDFEFPPESYVEKVTTRVGLPKTMLKSSSNEFDLVVFDVDFTLTRDHSCMRGKPEVIPPEQYVLYINDQDAEELRNFVSSLISKGIKVAIASYGRKNNIKNLMNYVFMGFRNPFNDDNIITPADVSSQYDIDWPECYEPTVSGYNKNTMLYILKERYNIDDINKILLVDDTGKVVTDAIMGGFSSLPVPRGQGFPTTKKTIIEKYPSLN